MREGNITQKPKIFVGNIFEIWDKLSLVSPPMVDITIDIFFSQEVFCGTNCGRVKSIHRDIIYYDLDGKELGSLVDRARFDYDVEKAHLNAEVSIEGNHYHTYSSIERPLQPLMEGLCRLYCGASKCARINDWPSPQKMQIDLIVHDPVVTSVNASLIIEGEEMKIKSIANFIQDGSPPQAGIEIWI